MYYLKRLSSMFLPHHTLVSVTLTRSLSSLLLIHRSDPSLFHVISPILPSVDVELL